VLPTRKPRRLVGRNVVTEFIAAGGGPEARERLLRRLRTEGRWDPQIPNFRAPAPPQNKFVISLEPYWTHTSRRANRRRRVRTEAKPMPATRFVRRGRDRRLPKHRMGLIVAGVCLAHRRSAKAKGLAVASHRAAATP
jgi:hypothetical protein